MITIHIAAMQLLTTHSLTPSNNTTAINWQPPAAQVLTNTGWQTAAPKQQPPPLLPAKCPQLYGLPCGVSGMEQPRVSFRHCPGHPFPTPSWQQLCPTEWPNPERDPITQQQPNIGVWRTLLRPKWGQQFTKLLHIYLQLWYRTCQNATATKNNYNGLSHCHTI